MNIWNGLDVILILTLLIGLVLWCFGGSLERGWNGDGTLLASCMNLNIDASYYLFIYILFSHIHDLHMLCRRRP